MKMHVDGKNKNIKNMDKVANANSKVHGT